MSLQTLSLTGDIFVEESSVSRAVSSVKEGLISSTERFEQFFEGFALKVNSWNVTRTEETPQGLFVHIEARGELNGSKEDLNTYILSHEADLYFDVNGFVPTHIE